MIKFDRIVSKVVDRSNDNSEAWSSDLCVSSIASLLVATINCKRNALQKNVFLDEDTIVCSSVSFNLSAFFSRSNASAFIINAKKFLFTFLFVKDKRTTFQYQDVCIFHSRSLHIETLSSVIFQKRTPIHICFTLQERETVCSHCENLWTYISQFQTYEVKFLVVFRSSIHHAIWFLQILNISWSQRAKVRSLLRSLVHVSLVLVWTLGSVLDWTSSAFRSYCRIWRSFWSHRSRCILQFYLATFICNSCAFCSKQDIELFHTVQDLQSWSDLLSQENIFKSFWSYRIYWFANCDFWSFLHNHIVVAKYHWIHSLLKNKGI